MTAAGDERSLVLVERDRGVAIATLNRPDALNALSTALVRRIAAVFRELQDDPSVGAVVLTGAGRAFSAGVDLKEFGDADPQAGDRGASDALPAALGGFDRPIVGAINGFAITGGFELALLCDLLVASPEARFADTHARVGIVPGWGLTQRLAQRVGIGRAKELSFTGNFLSAEQACAWGLVNRIVPSEELVPTCVALARDMVSCDPVVVKEIKRLIDLGCTASVAEGLRAEDAASRAHMKRLAGGDVAARRAGVMERGRKQAGS